MQFHAQLTQKILNGIYCILIMNKAEIYETSSLKNVFDLQELHWVQNIKTASYNSARTNLNPYWFLCSYMIWEADFQSRFLCNTKKICFTGTNCIIKIPIFSLILSTIFFQHWVDNANLKELISLDVDASDNLTEEALFNFINVYGPQLKGR